MQHPRHLISESNDSTLCQLLLSVMKTSLTFRSTIKRDQKQVKTLGATFKLDVRSSFFSTPELFNFITAYQCKSSQRRTSQVHQSDEGHYSAEGPWDSPVTGPHIQQRVH